MDLSLVEFITWDNQYFHETINKISKMEKKLVHFALTKYNAKKLKVIPHTMVIGISSVQEWIYSVYK